MRNQAIDAQHLQTVSARFSAGEITRDQGRMAVIDLILLRLRCSRVSLWRFDGEPGNLSMLCFAAKEAGGQLDTIEKRLELSEYRDYFDALIHQGAYVSNDAMHDANLQGLRGSYLERHGVMAMLDAAFLVNGRVYGMACCEQIGSVRVWRADELTDLRAIVAKVVMLMASSNDPALMGSPSLPMTPLSASQEADLKRFDQRRR
jgi:GAF domain-containing protein